MEELKCLGVEFAELTLHVGIGTFRPVKTENILDHHMHSEHYTIDHQACEIINRTKGRGGRVIAVGTTSRRVLETVGRRWICSTRQVISISLTPIFV